MAATTRERMIGTAARLLQHRGYHGMSLNDVLAEANAPRGSLYFHFPGGKDQLVAEATRESLEAGTEALRTSLADAPRPGAGVRAFLEQAAQWMEGSGFGFGCPVAPLILDDANADAQVGGLCSEAFERWTGLIRDALVDAGVQQARAETLAMMVVATEEGTFLLARAYRDAAPIRAAARELEALLDQALPGRPDR